MKKRFVLLLCLILIITWLPACGTQRTDSTIASTDSTQSTADGEFPSSVTDGVAPGTLPLVPKGTKATLTIGLPKNPLTVDYETNEMTLRFEQDTGIDLEFVLYDNSQVNYTSQISAQIAANEKLPDLFWYTPVTDSLLSEWGNDGTLINLLPYIEEHGYWFWEAHDKVAAEYGDAAAENLILHGLDPISGALYGMVGSNLEQGADHCINILINRQWLNNLGMEAPANLEELYEVLVAFRDEDPNGNGLQDEIPLIYHDGGYRCDITEYIINAFVFCNDSSFFNVTDGKLWVPYDTEEYRQALIYMNKLYTEGLFSEFSWSVTLNGIKNMLAPKDGINTLGIVGSHPINTLDMTLESSMEYWTLAPLADETGKGGYAAIDPVYNAYKSYITSDCDDPVLAFRFLDYLYSEEPSIIQRYGTPGKNWVYAEEGAVTSSGHPANITILDDPWSTVNNAVWHSGALRISWGQIRTSYDPESEGKIRSHRIQMSRHLLKSYQETRQPEEIFDLVMYNAQEQEIVTEFAAPVLEFILESRALFISNAMDPNDDTDWNNYLENLNSFGLPEYLEASQSAYTRMSS